MRHIISLHCLLLLAFSSVTAQSLDTLYIYSSNGDIERIAVSSIDSMTFTAFESDIFVNSWEYSDTVTHPIAVDLGLSVKWASCNIGASSPLELGSFFAWGEVEEKATFSLMNYKWYDNSKGYWNKYCPMSEIEWEYGVFYPSFYDGKIWLEPEDDVATVKWGGNWRMPYFEELEEIYTQCTIKRILLSSTNEVVGFKIIGPNGNSITIPYYKHSFYGMCVYWLNCRGTGDLNDNKGAMRIDEKTKKCWLSSCQRDNGLPVRPVCE